MNILVTGGAGYIGSHTVKMLNKMGKNVVVYDNLVKGHKDAVKCPNFVEGDIFDSEKLEWTIKKYNIDSVVHFAAYSLVGESMEKPQMYYYNNVQGTLNLLDVMLKNNVKKLVFSSTAAVYGEPERVPITEDISKNPTNVYGRTKLIMENAMEDYSRSYGLKYVALRYFNACGADDEGDIGEDHSPETHLIPLVLQTCLGKRESIKIFGDDYNTKDGTCIRDYIHVNDLAEAHILALEALYDGKNSNVYNLGNGNGFTVKEIIEAAEEVTGINIKKEIAPRRAGDPAVLIASSEKIRRELNWNPKYTDIKRIIETAWRWHKNHPNGYDDKK
ncbi:MAG: galE [Caloramator sp.]|jgi:UDP-glucose 4-epimerase|uniref:UDP-glucose 4-epimerase n=1 Tax=Caloramator proteoclasticus DSM 10124 TaxID=1121262 RepID=A0A1M5A665_9CLOT|nr:MULTISPECIES: UDP-glucose 4-epimerase GalE [Caloramator]MBZ4663367.1 galE [Caloramator sp.]SHF25617.1 UDP-glucose 4-epimerase [Caloramator proteoclasticus DSM 10124]